MNVRKVLYKLGCIIIFMFLTNVGVFAKVNYDHYFSWEEMERIFKDLVRSDKGVALNKLTATPGGKDLILFSAVSRKQNPAIFVAANMSGNIPIASSGAVYLAEFLIEHPSLYNDYSWYILPCGNPDAYINNIFSTTLPVNRSSVNNDMDDKTNEDGREDLNSDGFFSMMRCADPLGTYKIDKKEKRLMVVAQDTVPAACRYKVYSEGIDNDGDGLYNEDGEGGVNIAHTFPYQYDYLDKESGLWAGSENETFELLRFFSEHPEICMTVTLGESDFLRTPFIKARKATEEKKFSIPKRYASYFGFEGNRTYTMNEMLKVMKKNRAEADINESYVYRILNSGPLKSPIQSDKSGFDFLSHSFLKHFKDVKCNTKFINPLNPANGSFELWSYYHLGLPSVAMRLWDVPILQPDSVKTKNKLSRDAAFLVYSDSLLDGNGFVDWGEYSHPELGLVEIGGIINNLQFNPKEDMISAVLEKQIPWFEKMAAGLPHLSVSKVKSAALGKNTYRVDVFIENSGKMAWPLMIGEITRRPAPVVLLTGDESTVFIQGKARTTITSVMAGGVKKYSFVVHTRTDELNVRFEAQNVKTTSGTYQLK